MLPCHRPMRIVLHPIAIAVIAMLCSQVRAQSPTPTTAQAIMGQSLSQQNGDFTVMPRNLVASRRSGLGLSVDTRWVNAYGYRPVEVTIISFPKPSTAAHTIKIQLHSGWNNVISVEQDFELPLGATRASTIVAVPFYEQSIFGFWWDVWVDGFKDIDLSMDKEDAARRVNGTGVSASSVRALIPESAAIPKSMISNTGFDFEVLSLKLGDFPRRWIDYTCLDVASLSFADLQLLAKTNPAALEAIERWERTGGQLWVSNVGEKLEKLPEVSKLLQVPDALLPALADPILKDANDKKVETGDAAGGGLPGDHPTEVGWRPARFGGRGLRGAGAGFCRHEDGTKPVGERSARDRGARARSEFRTDKCQ